jgi:hypothetical protein
METTLETQSITTLPLVQIEPTMYANGFICGYSATDAFLIFQLNNHPVGKVQVSFEGLKSLQTALNETVNNIEAKLNRTLQTGRELEPILFGNKNSE